MITTLLIAAALGATPPTTNDDPHMLVREAEHALNSGRLSQARLMIGRAITARASGARVERLFADLAFASGNNAEALTRYEQLIGSGEQDVLLLERAGLAALKLGRPDKADPWLARATAMPLASWRAWNARGIVADERHDWTEADVAYEQARTLAPNEPTIVNNVGWSLLMRGDWPGAVSEFERAAALGRPSIRLLNNLELARAALASDLPRRNPGEADRAWAERLNDAGVAAAIRGDRKRAIAAFSQALEASGRWYERAANNLQAAKSQ